MGSDASSWPLVVDLDGTLINTNSGDESFLNSLRQGPVALCRLPIELFAGRSADKACPADVSSLDVETWPVRQDFIDYLKGQVEGGRTVVLATAADRSVADAVAARFPFISEVMASSADCSMRGRAKAARLRERFPLGFIYAGGSAADLVVWREAASSILVNAPGSVVRRAAQLREPSAVFPRPPFTLHLLRRSLRLHQWIKNALIFVPLVLGGKIGDAHSWFNAFLGFIALGFAASATYVANDLWDLPNDRRHWTKRSRPLASGDLSIRMGLLLAAAGMAIGLGLAAVLGPAAFAVMALYVALTLGYSFALKPVPILDVLTLASLFTLRLGFGIVLVDVRLSLWLLVFSMFLFLSLSLAKRHTEVRRANELGLGSVPGRGYLATDAPLTLGMGLAAMLGAILILVLYLIEDAIPRELYGNPTWLWAIPPAMFLFLGRVWLLSQRGQLQDDPVAFALKDRWSLLLGLLSGLCFVAALVGVGRP